MFESIIRNILQEESLGEKFTEKFIEGKLFDVIKQYFENDMNEDNLIAFLENTIQELEALIY